MKGKIFAENPVDPCPHCGTPRIEVDADNDYLIYPGRVVPASCDCQDCRQSTRWKSEFVTDPGYPERFICETCGHKVSWTRQRDTVRDQWMRKETYFRYISSCEFSHHRIERLEGCEKCSVLASWPGLHDE